MESSTKEKILDRLWLYHDETAAAKLRLHFLTIKCNFTDRQIKIWYLHSDSQQIREAPTSPSLISVGSNVDRYGSVVIH